MGSFASQLAEALNLKAPGEGDTLNTPDDDAKSACSAPETCTAPPKTATVADIPQDNIETVEQRVQPASGKKCRQRRWLQIYRLAWGRTYGRICMDCGTRMIFNTEANTPAPARGIIATIDHVTQRSRGGTDDPSNLQVICACCNGIRQLYDPSQAKKSVDKAISNLERRREQAILHAYEFCWPHLSS
jgi:hypothetical protein